MSLINSFFLLGMAVGLEKNQKKEKVSFWFSISEARRVSNFVLGNDL